MALTQGMPPSRSRISMAIRLARSRSSDSRLTLKAMSGKRAPMATAPAVACTRASPSSGVFKGSLPMTSRISSNPLPRKAARFLCSGMRAASS